MGNKKKTFVFPVPWPILFDPLRNKQNSGGPIWLLACYSTEVEATRLHLQNLLKTNHFPSLNSVLDEVNQINLRH